MNDRSEEQIARFKQAMTQPASAACEACLAQLDDYVRAQLAGKDYAAHYPEVATHLDRCLDCAGTYARLYEFELAAQAEALPSPEHLPQPDLTFLSTRSDRAIPPDALIEKLRAAVQQIGDRLTLQLSTELLALLQPRLAAAFTRAPADTDRYGEVLLELDSYEPVEGTGSIAVAAYRDAQYPDECLVEVTVARPDRVWPNLADYQVSVQWPDEQREALTDAWGVAAFEGVPVARLADLHIEIVW